MILSGGNYGGYVIEDKKAVLYGTDENNEQFIVDKVACTLSKTTYNINGWLYDTARSVNNDTAEFIGMQE